VGTGENKKVKKKEEIMFS